MGVYVLLFYQKERYDLRIMNCLEAEIRKMNTISILDTLLPAICLQKRRGCQMVGFDIYKKRYEAGL